MREIMRGLGEGVRQGWRQRTIKAFFAKNERRHRPLTSQEKAKSLQAAGEIVADAKGFLQNNKEVKIVDPKGIVLNIKRGNGLDEHFREGAEIIISGAEERAGVWDTYLFTESYAFYPNGTYIVMSQSRTGDRRVTRPDTIRMEAREKDLKKLIKRIRRSQAQKG